MPRLSSRLPRPRPPPPLRAGSGREQGVWRGRRVHCSGLPIQNEGHSVQSDPSVNIPQASRARAAAAGGPLASWRKGGRQRRPGGGSSDSPVVRIAGAQRAFARAVDAAKGRGAPLHPARAVAGCGGFNSSATLVRSLWLAGDAVRRAPFGGGLAERAQTEEGQDGARSGRRRCYYVWQAARDDRRCPRVGSWPRRAPPPQRRIAATHRWQSEAMCGCWMAAQLSEQ